MARGKNRRRGRGRRNNGSGTWIKILALILLPLVVLGGGGFGLYQHMQIEKIGSDYCYARTDQAQTAVYLDYSVNGNLSGAQRRDLVEALNRAYAETPVNGKVMIFTTARDVAGSIARPVFVMCRPAEDAGEQARIGAPEQTGPRLAHIAGEARATFLAEIDRILAETQDTGKAALESPILANVQAISRYAGFQGRDRRFVWLSDGIENSETARFGGVKGDMPPVATFTQRSDYDLIKPDPLTGMHVTVLLVESIALPQTGLEFVTHDEMRRWWPQFFKANGAASVRLERLRRVHGT